MVHHQSTNRPIKPARNSCTPSPEPQVHLRPPTDAQWAVLFPHIRRLYVCERWKLRHVMQHMEQQYGFYASEQMYKKRFAKLGFHKNSRRSPAKVARQRADEDDSPTQQSKLRLQLPMPTCRRDRQNLALLSGVRTWSRAFFDSLALPNDQQPILFTRHLATQEMGSAFKLVLTLLRRGHGHAAGRVARKAFLLAEDFLAREGPVLTWNLLEMMHHMLSLRHTQLLKMLLGHIAALALGRMAPKHPLHDILRALQTLATTPPDGDDREILHVLEQAWVLNAQMLFDRFDPLLINMYCNMTCMTCSIIPSPAIFEAADQWLAMIEAPSVRHEEAPVSPAGLLMSTPSATDDEFDTSLFTPDALSPASGCDDLITTSVASLRAYAETIFREIASFRGDTATLLPMLAWLVSTKILEATPAVKEWDETDQEAAMYANSLACAIDILVSHGIEQCPTSSDTVGRLRALIALRGYAVGETNAQTIQDMWLLRDALLESGQHADAERVERDVESHINTYVSDIPATYA